MYGNAVAQLKPRNSFWGERLDALNHVCGTAIDTTLILYCLILQNKATSIKCLQRRCPRSMYFIWPIHLLWLLEDFVTVYLFIFVYLLMLGDQPGADLGPLISPQARGHVNRLIQSGVDEGASLLLDGRNVKVKGFENGNFVGPTIISNVTVSHL